MTFEILTAEEAAVIEQNEMPEDQRVNWLADSLIMYCRNADGKLVGRMGLWSIKMVEGTWCDESVRGSSVPFRLLTQMEAMIQHLGNSGVFAMVSDEQGDVKGYLERIGYERFPATMMFKEFVKKEVAA